jgi:hypothetical protein
MIGEVTYDFLFVELNYHGKCALRPGLRTGRSAVITRTEPSTSGAAGGATD